MDNNDNKREIREKTERYRHLVVYLWNKKSRYKDMKVT